jgi:hypothetical protein
MISIIIVVNNHYFHHYNGYEPWKPTHGYHAGICIAGGERVSLRDLVYRWAERACLRPEREKSGLLLPQRPDDVSSSHRRPGAVFLPWFLGPPTALAFAITAPQRLDVLGARGSESAAVAYSEHKRRHLGTSAACAASKSPFSQCGDDRGLSPWGWEGLAQISRAVTFAGHAVPGATTLLQQACRLAAQGWGDRRLVWHFPLSCMWVGPCCFH